MADAVDMAGEIEGEHLARALERARVAVPAGVPGVCDDCGEDSPRLVGGRCARCRDGRNKLAVRREATAVPAPAPVMPPRRQWIGTAPMAPQQEEVTVAGERKRAVTMTATGPVLEAIESGQDAHGGLGASALALIAAGLAGARAAPPPERPGSIDLASVHFDALLDAVKTRFERAGAVEAEQLAVLKRRASEAEARAETAETALAALRGKVEALLG